MTTVLYLCPFSNNSKSGVQRFAREIIEGVKSTDIQSRQLFWNRENGLIRSYIVLLKEYINLQSHVEIIHFVVLSPYILPFMMVAKLNKKKIVITYHGIYTKEISKFRQPLQYLLFLLTDKMSRSIADKIVSLNQYLLNELDIRKKYVIIPNPFLVKNKINHVTSLQKITDIVLVTASTFKIKKKAEGLNLLLQVMEEISLPSQKIRLLVFGDGKHLEDYKKKYGYLKNIIFMGFNADFTDYLEHSNAYIHISGLDNQPYVIIEAMMKERVILCNDLGGILEMIDSKNNYVVQLDELSIKKGLENLLHDIAYNDIKIRKMGVNNRILAIRKFAHETVMEQYSLLYETLAQIK